MNRLKTISMLAALILAMAASIPALAHGGRYHSRSSVSVGFVWGSPYWYYPYPYPYPYYYYPRAVAVPADTVYVEREDNYIPPDQAHGYWYFCKDAKAYYPYVKQCPGGWQRVSPQPAGELAREP